MEPASFLEFIRLVVALDTDRVSQRLRSEPALATMASPIGASREDAADFFFDSISHYLYVGDTALHMAAASSCRPIAERLVAHGADCKAKNRRGAQPLHYAADSDRREPQAQADVIEYLISIGAAPNAVDDSGVAPLHRAVRRRSTAAVQALLTSGADPRQRNKSGSTPLHLAVQNTGASGSASDDAKRQQAEIIGILLKCGAKPTDRDARGKSVEQAATSEWIRKLLRKDQAD